MILSIDLKKNKIDKNNIIIMDKIKNNVIPNPNSSYSRLLYSDKYVTFNGMYLNFILNSAKIVNLYNKILCHVNEPEIIHKILSIEREILSKYNSRKNKKFKLAELLKENCISVFFNEKYNDPNINSISLCKKIDIDKPVNVILKISGIWENNKEFGLTIKFFIQNI